MNTTWMLILLLYVTRGTFVLSKATLGQNPPTQLKEARIRHMVNVDTKNITVALGFSTGPDVTFSTKSNVEEYRNRPFLKESQGDVYDQTFSPFARRLMSTSSEARTCDSKDKSARKKEKLQPLRRAHPEGEHQFIDRYYNSSNHIMLGVIIENFSKYKLTNKRSSKIKNIIQNPQRTIDGDSIDVVIVHNNGIKYKELDDAITWVMEGKTSKTEITVAFRIPYSGACSSSSSKSRGNMYSVTLKEGSKNPIKDNLSDVSSRCFKTKDGLTRIESNWEPLMIKIDSNPYRYKGKYCTPVLTLKVFSNSRSSYMKWYLVTAVAMMLLLIVSILIIVWLRKLVRKKKEISNANNDIQTEEQEDDQKDTKISVHQNTEDAPVLNKQNIVVRSVSLLDGPKERIDSIDGLPQVYMSVTSYDMVYMSQTSYDMIRNYRPSIPMPFKSIEANRSSNELSSSFESCVSSFENLSHRKLSEIE